MTQRLSELLGQPVVIDNKAGASGTIGAEFVARAEPDGYTLLTSTVAMLAITPHVMKLSYDPLKSFTPLAMLSVSNGVLAVNERVPARSVAELVAYGKANPGKLTYGSAGIATYTHLSGVRFGRSAGIEIRHVPYRGSAPSVTDCIAGNVDMVFDPVAIPAVRDGKLRGLAALDPAPNPLLPGLPTLRESGYADNGADAWFGLLGPAGLPEAIRSRLIQAIATAHAAPEVGKAMAIAGLRPALLTGDAFAARIRADYRSLGEVVKNAGITLS
jgi:tripartite-type tricarboxylate transporter receptor subunit TctC